MSVPLLTIAVALLSIVAILVGSYLAWLWLAPPASDRDDAIPELPPVLVLVPVFDEAALIEGKLANLASLSYPGECLHVVIVDGGSTDGTVESVMRWMAGRNRCDLLRTTYRNKTHQLNAALRAFDSEEWILVTDADALLEPDTLMRLVAMGLRDASIGVIGAGVVPAAAHQLESLHWRATRWLQRQEFARGSAAIVAAPCYLTRRQFIADMPHDTVADDVHVACRAMRAGRRVCLGHGMVVELRSPRTLWTLIRHKYRKADSYLREVFRFLPHVRDMARPMRTIFVCRAVLLTVVPVLCLHVAVFSSLALFQTLTWPTSDEIASLAVAVSVGALVFTWTPARQAIRLALLGTMLVTIAAAALFGYPFSRQTASFSKIVASPDPRAVMSRD